MCVRARTHTPVYVCENQLKIKKARCQVECVGCNVVVWACSGHSPPKYNMASFCDSVSLSVAVWMVFVHVSEGPECELIACTVPGCVPVVNV